VSSTSLLELAAHARLVTDFECALLETGGEITPEIENMLNSIIPVDISKSPGELKILLASKVDAYHYIIDKMLMAAQMLKDQANARVAVSSSCLALVESLKARIKQAMEKLETTELSGYETRFKLSATKKALEINETELPTAWLMEIVTYKPDKEKIKAALEAGQEIPGCKLVGGTALRKYLNNPSSNKKKEIQNDSATND